MTMKHFIIFNIRRPTDAIGRILQICDKTTVLDVTNAT